MTLDEAILLKEQEKKEKEKKYLTEYINALILLLRKNK